MLLRFLLFVDVGWEFLERRVVLIKGQLQDFAGLPNEFAAASLKLCFAALIRGRLRLKNLDLGLLQQHLSSFGIRVTTQGVIRVFLDELIQIGQGLIKLFELLLGAAERFRVLPQRDCFLIRDQLSNLGRNRWPLRQLVQVEQCIIKVMPFAKPLQELEVRLFSGQWRRGNSHQHEPEGADLQPGFHRLILKI